LPQTSGTHIRDSWQFKSMYTLQRKTRPTHHTLSTLGPCMTLDHTYLTRFTYSNFSWVAKRFGRILLLMRNRDSRLHLQHSGWPICGPNPVSLPLTANEAVGLSQASVDDMLLGLLDPYTSMWSVRSILARGGLTHMFLIDTCMGYNLGGADFPHTTPRPSQPTISTFHLRAPPDLQFNHKPTKVPKFKI
jgi:hypothetical protein